LVGQAARATAKDLKRRAHSSLARRLLGGSKAIPQWSPLKTASLGTAKSHFAQRAAFYYSTSCFRDCFAPLRSTGTGLAGSAGPILAALLRMLRPSRSLRTMRARLAIEAVTGSISIGCSRAARHASVLRPICESIWVEMTLFRRGLPVLISGSFSLCNIAPKPRTDSGHVAYPA
jgi:hypothetical protein